MTLDRRGFAKSLSGVLGAALASTQGEGPVPYLPDFLECRSGKVWPNDRSLSHW